MMERKESFAVACLLICALVIACSRATTPATEPVNTTTGEGRIVFISSDREWMGSSGIYAMEGDGSEVRQLTSWWAEYPAWSPDGRHIAFGSGHEIRIMNVDGSEERQLTNRPANDRCPSWSPDGKRIAFTSDREGSVDIYTMKVDGGGVRRLTKYPGGFGVVGVVGCPSWSPDGKQIVFMSHGPRGCKRYIEGHESYDDCESEELYVIKANSKGLTCLTKWEHYQWRHPPPHRPTWSPDGKRIAFATGLGEIHIVNADGSGVTKLTNGLYPTWSPDGERIAFMSDRDGNWDIYAMKADGTQVTNLTNHAAWDGFPSWGSR